MREPDAHELVDAVTPLLPLAGIVRVRAYPDGRAVAFFASGRPPFAHRAPIARLLILGAALERCVAQGAVTCAVDADGASVSVGGRTSRAGSLVVGVCGAADGVA